MPSKRVREEKMSSNFVIRGRGQSYGRGRGVVAAVKNLMSG